jgi:hypothetical protein
MVAVLLSFFLASAALNLLQKNNFFGGTGAAVTKVFCYLAGTTALQRLPEG